jgi:hypothetical protein
MALGERFRSGGARGIAQFLAEHQHCDAGFDVRRDEAPGSGKLTITCQGCGQTVSYNAAEVGEIGAFDLPQEGPARVEAPEPADRTPADKGPNGTRPPVRSESSGLVSGGPGPRPAEASRRSGLPRWLVPGLIGLVIAAGVAMIAIGLLRSGGDGETEEPPAPTQAEAPPPAETQQQPTQTQPTTPETTTPDATPAPPAETPATGGVNLRTRSFGTFSVGVPAGWSASREADGASLEAPGSTAGLTVIGGSSDLSAIEFARSPETELFLAGRRPGASVGDPKPVRFDGRPGARTIVTYSGSEEQVTFTSQGGTVYALIVRIERGASAQVEDEAAAALASFEP